MTNTNAVCDEGAVRELRVKGFTVAQVVEYLNMLRHSGVTNMFGAGPFIESKFSVSASTARKLLVYWMDTFTGDAEDEDEGQFDAPDIDEERDLQG